MPDSSQTFIFLLPPVFWGRQERGLSPFPVQQQCDVFLTEILPPGPLVSRRTVSWSWRRHPTELECAGCFPIWKGSLQADIQISFHSWAEVRPWFFCCCFLLGVIQQRAVLQCFGGFDNRRLHVARWESLYSEGICPTGLSENTWHSLDLNQLQNGKSSTSEMSLNAYEYLNSNSIIEGGGEK